VLLSTIKSYNSKLLDEGAAVLNQTTTFLDRLQKRVLSQQADALGYLADASGQVMEGQSSDSARQAVNAEDAAALLSKLGVTMTSAVGTGLDTLGSKLAAGTLTLEELMLILANSTVAMSSESRDRQRKVREAVQRSYDGSAVTITQLLSALRGEDDQGMAQVGADLQKGIGQGPSLAVDAGIVAGLDKLRLELKALVGGIQTQAGTYSVRMVNLTSAAGVYERAADSTVKDLRNRVANRTNWAKSYIRQQSDSVNSTTTAQV
jgi:hypothetical protein